MKLIFVTGGVMSGLGKGITGASIGALIKSAGYSVFMQKLDGYLNVDPGTMNPIEHGEVFVMDDGFESDLDLGHYERFIDTNLNRFSSYTTGRIFEEIINEERSGKYLGETVQIIPHVTDKVKQKIKHGMQQSGADIGIIEIGGTIGDIENEYLVEAARQLRHELGYHSVQFVHLTYVPYLGASKELKTKPTQNSVKDLMRRGISPDFLFVRADTPIPEGILQKISAMTGIQHTHVIPAPTIQSIYQVPLDYHQYRVGHGLLDALHMDYTDFDLSSWETLQSNRLASTTTKTIAMVGKYTDLEDAYFSLNEAIKCAGWMQQTHITLLFIDAETVTKNTVDQILGSVSGVCVPGGFGNRGIEGMIVTAQYAREQQIPYLGICLGSQIMAIEFARNVLGIVDAVSEETHPDGKNLVVHMMHHQRSIDAKGATMRLGAYPCRIDPSSHIGKMYDSYARPESIEKTSDWLVVSERHRHRYEFNNQYREQFEAAGFHCCGTSPDDTLVEMVEITDHPCMIGTQAHPELTSRPTAVHPMIMGWVEQLR